MGAGHVGVAVVALQLGQHHGQILDLAGFPVPGGLGGQVGEQQKQEVIQVADLAFRDLADPRAPARLQADQVALFQQSEGLSK